MGPCMSLCKVVLDPRIFRPANDQRDHNKHDKGGSTNKLLQERASSMCMNRIVLKYGITVTKQHRKGGCAIPQNQKDVRLVYQ